MAFLDVDVGELYLSVEECCGVAHNFDEVEALSLRWRLSREVQETSDNLSDSCGLADNHVEILSFRLGHLLILPQEMSEG